MSKGANSKDSASNNERAHHIYHAHSFGVAGTIVRPVPQVIHTQAATSLSPCGGHGSHHVEDFEMKGIVSFKSAFVEVGGSYDEDNKTHTTVASAVIEKLNIMDVVTADRVVARLSSYHPKIRTSKSNEQEGSAKPNATPKPDHSQDDPKLAEPSIVPTGSYFENLRIAGYLVNRHLDNQIFCDYDTFSSVEDAQKNGPKEWLLVTQLKRDANGNLDSKEGTLDWAKATAPTLNRFCTGLEKLPKTHGIFICSPAHRFHEAFNGSSHGLNLFGSVIHIPRFGVIHIAELVIEKHSRRLNMLRIHLGSPTQGDLTAGTVLANGTTYPPTGPH